MCIAVLESPPIMPLKLDAAKMRELRVSLDLTQAEAAKRAAMPQSRWSDIEGRGQTNVTVETLGIIADALSCDPATLLVKLTPKRKKKG